MGQSGWEFGCNEDPKQKGDDDFAARVKAIKAGERKGMHFVFVTPRTWKTKDAWRKEKEALGKWKSVRVYDASDIEQWLERTVLTGIDFPKRSTFCRSAQAFLKKKWRAWSFFMSGR